MVFPMGTMYLQDLAIHFDKTSWFDPRTASPDAHLALAYFSATERAQVLMVFLTVPVDPSIGKFLAFLHFPISK